MPAKRGPVATLAPPLHRPTAAVTIYGNGAFVPRFFVNGAATQSREWVSGHVRLSESVIELGRTDAPYSIPISSVLEVGSPPAASRPPPPEFTQVFGIRHVDRGADAWTLLATPAYTLQNFPLQLSAVLTGVVRAFAPRMGARGVEGYDEASFAFAREHVLVGRAGGGLAIPLKDVGSVVPSRARDGDGNEFVEWTLDYVEAGAPGIRSLSLLSYERPTFLFALLRSLAALRSPSGGAVARPAQALTETAQQAAVMLYAGGMSGRDIASALGISRDALEKIFDDLVKQELAKVVRVERELALTPAGMRAVDEIMKNQLQAGAN